MRGVVPLVLLGLAACGDNLLSTGQPLAETADLVIVAHQDDDLLFMQPDLLEAVRGGQGVTSVYITAGNGRLGIDKAETRYEGLRSAYSAAAGASDWHCGYIEIVGKTAEHCRLATQNISLVFLGYPDGGKEGEYTTSLLHLFEGTTTNVTTIARETATYDRDSLIDTVAQIVRLTEPARVRTLEVSSTHGRDHSDHMLAGAVALLSVARANSPAELLSYRGYEIAAEPVNKVQSVYDAVFAVLSRYEACATECAACGDACTTIDGTHVAWLQRRYAVGFRRSGGGRLRIGNDCVALDGSLTSCEVAPSWTIDPAGQLRSGALCLVVGAGGVTTGPCLGGRERRFFVDDEGHIWSGVPPAPQSNMAYAHLTCLATGGGRVTAQLCGADRAPTWELAPPMVSTSRSTLQLMSTGRNVRLGDLTGDGKADLCEVASGGLYCAPGTGDGHFEVAKRIDSVAMALAIDPRSLTLGDVDGDGRVDACGRDANGVMCATAAKGFTTDRWSPSFSDGVARPSTSASLTALDANADNIADVCGVDMTGVVCAPRGLTAAPLLRSAWPVAMGSTVVWPADLDGDKQADWCAPTETGAACAVEAQRDLSTDGAPWAYSQAGVVDVTPATTATVALADIDADGRADLCSPREDRIVCARSQGRAFGPRTMTLAILPNQSVASAVWVGDLNGDQRNDVCVDTGPAITCAVQPSGPNQ